MTKREFADAFIPREGESPLERNIRFAPTQQNKKDLAQKPSAGEDNEDDDTPNQL